MALRPQRFLIDGVIDKTNPRRVVGWLRFAGLPQPMTLDLSTAGKDPGLDPGDGKVALLRSLYRPDRPPRDYWEGVSLKQTGKLGVTVERTNYGWHLSWYSRENGHVTLDIHRSELHFQERR
jgi:hypothetical protein